MHSCTLVSDTMDTTDTGHPLTVGSHCTFPDCKKLDFLPFVCDKCSSTFCLDHRLASSHDCKVSSDSPATLVEQPPEYFPCSVQNCHTREVVEFKCALCHFTVCLAHRHPEDHKCSGDPSKVSQGKFRAPLNLPATKDAPVLPRTKPSDRLNPTASKVQRMKLKMSAVGESGVPEDGKVFLEVQLFDGSTKAVFVDSRWSIGKACDSIKKALKLGCRYDVAKLREVGSMVTIPSDLLVKDVLADVVKVEFYIEESWK